MNYPEICSSFQVPWMNEKTTSSFETTRTESSSNLKINYTILKKIK